MNPDGIHPVNCVPASSSSEPSGDHTWRELEIPLLTYFGGKGHLIAIAWREVGYPDIFKYDTTPTGIYRAFGIYTGHLPKLLYLMAHRNYLAPFPLDVWYKLANYCIEKLFIDSDAKLLLRQCAPYSLSLEADKFERLVNRSNNSISQVTQVAPAPIQPQNSHESELSAARAALRRAQEENERLKSQLATSSAAAPSGDSDNCSICMQSRKIVALNCGHVFCEPCALQAQAQKACHICRQAVKNLLKLYQS